jgi:hypothetical protein
MLVPGSPPFSSRPVIQIYHPLDLHFSQQGNSPKRCLTTTAEETTASHDIFGTPIVLRITKSVFFSLISYTTYRLQASSFSQYTGHERYQDLASPSVDPLPRLPVSLSEDQSRIINTVAAQTTVYQGPPIGSLFHTTTPCASGRWGNHVDRASYLTPQRALSYRIPQQMPSTNDYTQAYSTMSAHCGHLPYHLSGRHNTEAYHGLHGRYQTQVKCWSISDPHRLGAVYGSHWLLSRCFKDGPAILQTWTSCNDVASHPCLLMCLPRVASSTSRRFGSRAGTTTLALSRAAYHPSAVLKTEIVMC